MDFDPYNLDTRASLNRLRIVDLPGVPLAALVAGQSGYDLLSLPALLQQIQAQRATLKLPEAVFTSNPRQVPHLFADCLRSPDSEIRQTAQAISRTMGQRLGLVLLALTRGDVANRDARTDWAPAVWEHWRTIRTIYIGGGLASGPLGIDMVQHAQALIDQYGALPLQIRCSPYGSHLPLIGAARRLPTGITQAPVFDFGGSFVKRAIAEFESDTLTQLTLLETQPAQWTSGRAAEANPEDNTRRLFEFMLDTISDTLRAAPAPAISLSMAAYSHDGQPISRQGGAYAHLNRLSANLRDHLSQQLSERLQTPISACLLHDGTAAAVAYAGVPDAAVIMLGSALGIGYVPPATGLHAVAPNIHITERIH